MDVNRILHGVATGRAGTIKTSISIAYDGLAENRDEAGQTFREDVEPAPAHLIERRRLGFK
jgi:hypothetical protein